MAYRQAMQRRNEYQRERREFAERLAEIVVRKQPLIYCDEASFNSFPQWSTHGATKVLR